MPKLADLDLYGNALEGTIPNSWASAGAFKTFIANANNHPKLFPSEFGQYLGIRGVM